MYKTGQGKVVCIMLPFTATWMLSRPSNSLLQRMRTRYTTTWYVDGLCETLMRASSLWYTMIGFRKEVVLVEGGFAYRIDSTERDIKTHRNLTGRLVHKYWPSSFSSLRIISKEIRIMEEESDEEKWWFDVVSDDKSCQPSARQDYSSFSAPRTRHSRASHMKVEWYLVISKHLSEEAFLCSCAIIWPR